MDARIFGYVLALSIFIWAGARAINKALKEREERKKIEVQT